MRSSSSLSLRGSEAAVYSWFDQIGVADLKHVGNEPGPPDFVGRYDNEFVAVEVSRLLPSDCWVLKKELAFAAQIWTLVADVYREAPDGPRWHVLCEYDPAQACPARQSTDWESEARRALSTPGPGGAFPLIPPDRQRGYGLELHLTRMPPGAAFGHLPEHDPALVTSALGSAPLEELLSALPRVIAEKASKVRSRTRYRSCDRWWLVLDDDILIAPSSILTSSERAEVSRRTAGPAPSVVSRGAPATTRMPTPAG